ncbi:MAG: hypothetical protein AB7D57_07470, partial [Desulfovibrionaceae bacterium]
GGGNKPFTGLESAQALADLLDIEATAAFLSAYFRARGLDLDLERLDFDAFLKKVESLVLADTPLAALSRAAENLRN